MTAACDAAAGGPQDAQLPAGVARRARRLLRWYPASWRARYGDEFTELLIAELTEQPRSRRRTANLARSGLLARLSCAGLTSYPLDRPAATRAGLATLACSIAAFLTVGTAELSQLGIGLQWAAPDLRGVTQAMALMSVALLAFAGLALLAAVPVGWAAIRACVRGRGRELLRPALLIAAGALILIVGGRHFGNGWPGTGGGRWWPVHSLVPAGVAAFGWAITMWFTSYWAHPAALAVFPSGQLAWIVLSPAALLALMTGTAQLLRRLELSPRTLRYAIWLGRAAGAGMAVFLGGALCWVAAADTAPQPLFHFGATNLAGLVVIATALITGFQALHRTRLVGAAKLSAGPCGEA